MGSQRVGHNLANNNKHAHAHTHTHTHTHTLSNHNDFPPHWLEEGPKCSLLGQAPTFTTVLVWSLQRNRKPYMCISISKIYVCISIQSLSCVQLFAIPWTAVHQASLSITNSQSLLKLMSIKSVMSSNHLILCPPLLLPPSIFPSIRVFSNESALRIR